MTSSEAIRRILPPKEPFFIYNVLVARNIGYIGCIEIAHVEKSA